MDDPPATPWRLRRIAGWGAALAFAVAVLFPVAYALVRPEGRASTLSLPGFPSGRYEVYVVDWGYHTAIIIEQPPAARLGPPGAEGAPLVEFAWGDRAFYYASDYRPWVLAATLVVPTESVVYVRGRSAPPEVGAADAVLRRTIDAATATRLAHGIQRSIRRGPNGGRAAPLAEAPGFVGRFYPAHGSYLWTRDCNWWTVARLAGTGLAEPPGGVVFTPQVPGRLLGFTPAGQEDPGD